MMIFGRRKKDNQPYVKDQKDSSTHHGNVKPVNGIKLKLFGKKKDNNEELREKAEIRKYARLKGITHVGGKPLDEIIDFISLDTLRIMNGDEPITQRTDKFMFPEESKVMSDLIIREDEGVMHGAIMNPEKTKFIGFRNLTEGDKRWWREKYAKMGIDFDEMLKQMQKK